MSAPTVTARPTPPGKLGVTLGWVLGGAAFLACLYLVDSRWGRLVELPEFFVRYGQLMAEGVFANPVAEPQQTFWVSALEHILESLYMAWWGTVIGALLSFPIAFLAAANVTPAPVVFVTRQVLNAIRAIPELIFAIAIMLPIFGFGPWAGALALGVGSIGSLGKLTSEVIEGIDAGPVEAARAGGARPLQILRWSIVPQVLPEAVALWFYRFEINIRAGTVLGVLGAGGIGAILNQLFNQRDWPRIGVTLAAIIIVTIIVDTISAAIRARIIRGPSASADATTDPAAIPI